MMSDHEHEEDNIGISPEVVRRRDDEVMKLEDDGFDAGCDVSGFCDVSAITALNVTTTHQNISAIQHQQHHQSQNDEADDEEDTAEFTASLRGAALPASATASSASPPRSAGGSRRNYDDMPAVSASRQRQQQILGDEAILESDAHDRAAVAAAPLASSKRRQSTGTPRSPVVVTKTAADAASAATAASGAAATNSVTATTAIGSSGSTGANKDKPISRHVRVAVRVRPQTAKEAMAKEHRQIVKLPAHAPGTVVVDSATPEQLANRRLSKSIVHRPAAFDNFHHVFGPHTEQEQVFEETTREIVLDAFRGMNGSVMAYGATGAGKTFSMYSSGLSAPGIIPRAAALIFKRKQELESMEGKEVSIRVWFVEVYNEQVRDLLAPHASSNSGSSASVLKLQDRFAGGVGPNGACCDVAGVTYVYPTSADQMLSIVDRGFDQRVSHETFANQHSSRSHAILSVDVEVRDGEDSANAAGAAGSSAADAASSRGLLGKMKFCDLAGSERAASTRNDGARFREGANINRSLLALGAVVQALSKPNALQSFIPYRGSKLTRLLRECIGGNCTSLLLVCVSPSSMALEETLNTLHYATLARRIETQVRVNSIEISPEKLKEQYELALSKKDQEIDALKEELRRLYAERLVNGNNNTAADENAGEQQEGDVSGISPMNAGDDFGPGAAASSASAAAAAAAMLGEPLARNPQPSSAQRRRNSRTIDDDSGGEAAHLSVSPSASNKSSSNTPAAAVSPEKLVQVAASRLRALSRKQCRDCGVQVSFGGVAGYGSAPGSLLSSVDELLASRGSNINTYLPFELSPEEIAEYQARCIDSANPLSVKSTGGEGQHQHRRTSSGGGGQAAAAAGLPPLSGSHSQNANNNNNNNNNNAMSSNSNTTTTTNSETAAAAAAAAAVTSATSPVDALLLGDLSKSSAMSPAFHSVNDRLTALVEQRDAMFNDCQTFGEGSDFALDVDIRGAALEIVNYLCSSHVVTANSSSSQQNLPVAVPGLRERIATKQQQRLDYEVRREELADTTRRYQAALTALNKEIHQSREFASEFERRELQHRIEVQRERISYLEAEELASVYVEERRLEKQVNDEFRAALPRCIDALERSLETLTIQCTSATLTSGPTFLSPSSSAAAAAAWLGEKGGEQQQQQQQQAEQQHHQKVQLFFEKLSRQRREVQAALALLRTPVTPTDDIVPQVVECLDEYKQYNGAVVNNFQSMLQAGVFDPPPQQLQQKLQQQHQQSAAGEGGSSGSGGSPSLGRSPARGIGGGEDGQQQQQQRSPQQQHQPTVRVAPLSPNLGNTAGSSSASGTMMGSLMMAAATSGSSQPRSGSLESTTTTILSPRAAAVYISSGGVGGDGKPSSSSQQRRGVIPAHLDVTQRRSGAHSSRNHNQQPSTGAAAAAESSTTVRRPGMSNAFWGTSTAKTRRDLAHQISLRSVRGAATSTSGENSSVNSSIADAVGATAASLASAVGGSSLENTVNSHSGDQQQQQQHHHPIPLGASTSHGSFRKAHGTHASPKVGTSRGNKTTKQHGSGSGLTRQGTGSGGASAGSGNAHVMSAAAVAAVPKPAILMKEKEKEAAAAAAAGGGGKDRSGSPQHQRGVPNRHRDPRSAMMSTGSAGSGGSGMIGSAASGGGGGGGGGSSSSTMMLARTTSATTTSVNSSSDSKTPMSAVKPSRSNINPQQQHQQQQYSPSRTQEVVVASSPPRNSALVPGSAGASASTPIASGSRSSTGNSKTPSAAVGGGGGGGGMTPFTFERVPPGSSSNNSGGSSTTAGAGAAATTTTNTSVASSPIVSKTGRVSAPPASSSSTGRKGSAHPPPPSVVSSPISAASVNNASMTSTASSVASSSLLTPGGGIKRASEIRAAMQQQQRNQQSQSQHRQPGGSSSSSSPPAQSSTPFANVPAPRISGAQQQQGAAVAAVDVSTGSSNSSSSIGGGSHHHHQQQQQQQRGGGVRTATTSHTAAPPPPPKFADLIKSSSSSTPAGGAGGSGKISSTVANSSVRTASSVSPPPAAPVAAAAAAALVAGSQQEDEDTVVITTSQNNSEVVVEQQNAAAVGGGDENAEEDDDFESSVNLGATTMLVADGDGGEHAGDPRRSSSSGGGADGADQEQHDDEESPSPEPAAARRNDSAPLSVVSSQANSPAKQEKGEAEEGSAEKE